MLWNPIHQQFCVSVKTQLKNKKFKLMNSKKQQNFIKFKPHKANLWAETEILSMKKKMQFFCVHLYYSRAQKQKGFFSIFLLN